MKDFFLTDDVFFRLAKLAENLAGIELTTNKLENIKVHLSERISQLGVSNFDLYYKLLQTNEVEITYFINLITNTSTSFFREKHHFDYLSNRLLPELVNNKNKIRIWSAGCATGEEPYSIAMAVYGSILNIEKYDIKILATDINTDALKIAREGIYDPDLINSIKDYKIWFKKINKPNKVQVDDRLKKLIIFKKLNLFTAWPIHKTLDVIFCRNVTIYLKKEATYTIIKKFDSLLEVGGILILGHSEHLEGIQERYICLGKSVYKKVQ